MQAESPSRTGGWGMAEKQTKGQIHDTDCGQILSKWVPTLLYIERSGARHRAETREKEPGGREEVGGTVTHPQ